MKHANITALATAILLGMSVATHAQGKVSLSWGNTGNSDSKKQEKKANETNDRPGLTVKKKDTSFEEAEAQRKIEEKKAALQRQAIIQAAENKAKQDEIKMIRELREAQKRRGRRQ